jgi:mRNA interferase RelE/StbE
VYRLVYRKAAAKALVKMPKPLARQFLEAFERLAKDPKTERLNIRPLMGREGYRLRIGGWRALYRIEENRLIIEIVRIGPRGNAYK